ncbi:TPA: DUF1642 domain-containing protein [Streptococcus suis]
MNKQEAIKQVEELYGYGSIAKTVTDIISQIDQPQQVVVPAFVDSFIRYAKAEGMSLSIAMNNAQNKESEWIIKNEDTFARAWLFGHEIEQEQLYTVEIPDPHSCYNYRFLSKNSKGVFLGASCDQEWERLPENQLTESEIKQDFEWAWQFAKEVG